jgi:hypothetical protein
MNNDSIYLHRINVASKGIIIWASISAVIILFFGVADVISGSAVSLTIFETAAFIICAYYANKGKYFLFWIILLLFIIDTIIVINIGTFTPLSFLIRLGIGILIVIGVASSLKVQPLTNSQPFSSSGTFNEKSSSNNYESSKKEEYEEIKYDENSVEYFYSILNINRNSTIEDIKKAYKEEIRKYHPDKVEHLGNEFKEIAEKKAKDINKAYNYFRKKFGF